jgi:alkylated DNA repair dioxygenase AlkB
MMQKISIQHGELELHPNFLTSSQANELFENLCRSVQWRQDDIFIFGKWLKQPRKTAMFSDSGIKYTYSGLRHKTQNWTKELQELKSNIERIAQNDFNLVLLNLYRDGNDSMGWHSDDEKELGQNPIIASISLGVERQFKFRPKKNNQNQNPFSVSLNHGSLLIMKGETQYYWQHSIAKSKKVNSERINLTFRKIIS